MNVGQKVVCVGAQEGGGWAPLYPRCNRGEQHPSEGSIYVIRFIDQHLGVSYLHFDEFPKRSYDAHYFRPIVEKKTDISVFTEMLNPTPHKVVERV